MGLNGLKSFEFLKWQDLKIVQMTKFCDSCHETVLNVFHAGSGDWAVPIVEPCNISF